jgi:hypothetical protein
MCISDPKPMDNYFLMELNKMVANKNEEYQQLFFERVNRLNTYMNCSGGIFNSIDTAALLMIELDDFFGESRGEIDVRNRK